MLYEYFDYESRWHNAQSLLLAFKFLFIYLFFGGGGKRRSPRTNLLQSELYKGAHDRAFENIDHLSK